MALARPRESDDRAETIEREFVLALGLTGTVRCGNAQCNCILMQYKPPVVAVMTCRRCRAWNVIVRS